MSGQLSRGLRRGASVPVELGCPFLVCAHRCSPTRSTPTAYFGDLYGDLATEAQASWTRSPVLRALWGALGRGFQASPVRWVSR